MKRYQVKLPIERHETHPDQYVAGYLGRNEGQFSEPISYPLKWARKKADAFGGKIEGFDLKFVATKVEAMTVDCTDFMNEVRLAIIAKVGLAPINRRLVVDAEDIADLYEDERMKSIYDDTRFCPLSLAQLRDLSFVCRGQDIIILESL